MSKCDLHTHGRPLFETSELTRVNEVVGNCMELKKFPNHLFEKLSNCVEKNNKAIQLGRIECSLIRFGNNNCS